MIISNKTEGDQTSSKVEDWRKFLPKNTVRSWTKYEGADIPNTDPERELLRTELLGSLWNLKQTLGSFPRHLRYTQEQFNHGFIGERQALWLPLLERFIEFNHQWRRYYPGVDITTRLGYKNLVALKDELSGPANLNPQQFEGKLHTVANGFETGYEYSKLIDDEVILEKFKSVAEAFLRVSQNYSADVDTMLERERNPGRYFPGT